jgi:HAD superfamily hydrolase (TIGR01458 family)
LWSGFPVGGRESVAQRALRHYDSCMGIRGILFDLDGTLYVGREVVAGAREAVGSLKASGLAVRYVTNTTRKSRGWVYRRMRSMGFEVGEEEIFTPALAAVGRIGSGTCFALVDDALMDDLAGLTLTDDRPDYVVVGDLGEGFTYERLNPAFRHLMEGAELLALQKNRYWQTDVGLALDAGPFVAALEFASGKKASVVGKPEREFFRLALEDLGLQAGQVAMVGDDAEADVVGAKRAGLVGIQVRTGKWQADAGEADLVIDSVADLPGVVETEVGER